MKSYFIKIQVILIVGLFLFASCSEKEDTMILEDTTNQSNLNSFLSLQDGNELVSLLDQLDEGIEVEKNCKISYFPTMWDIYIEIVKSNDSQQNYLMKKYPEVAKYNEYGEIELKVHDHTLAKLLNANGYIKIGNKIIKVNGDTIKAIINGDINRIKELESAIASTQDGIIIVERIINVYQNNLLPDKDYEWWGTVYSGSNKRVCWRKYGETSGIMEYAYIGGEIKYQEKKALGWFAQKRSLYLHVVCDFVTFNCHDDWCDCYEDIDISKSDVAKSLEVHKRVGSGPVKDIYGLVIDFNANGIIATR